PRRIRANLFRPLNNSPPPLATVCTALLPKKESSTLAPQSTKGTGPKTIVQEPNPSRSLRFPSLNSLATPLPARATHLHSRPPAAKPTSPKSNTPNRPAAPDRSTSDSHSIPSPAQTPFLPPAPHTDSPQSSSNTPSHAPPAHLQNLPAQTPMRPAPLLG